ncbi:ABC transporter permease [Fontibacillus phaseoli]|uniref:ABC transporter permease n=1 Tax=Fontibacillus phaseoli TaxID=1416533 RepID=UPI00319D9DEE
MDSGYFGHFPVHFGLYLAVRRHRSCFSSPAAANGYGFALLFLPYLSSAFVSTDTMPTWLQWIASNQPITPIIESLRSLLTGTEMQNHLWLAVVWCLVLLAGSLFWSNWAFQRKSNRR